MKEEKKTNKFTIISKGIVISVLLTLIMIFVLSIILSLTTISENIVMPTVIFISSFCLLIGGWIVSKSIKEKGILYGAVLGIIYMAILYIISSIINSNFSFNFNSIIMIGCGIVGGAIGGIIGVNT